MPGATSFVLDLGKEANLKAFDQRLDASLRQSRLAGTYSLDRQMERLYQSLFKDASLRSTLGDRLSGWVNETRHPLMRDRLNAAFDELWGGGSLSPDGRIVALAYGTRSARWADLAGRLGLRAFPTHFLAYRAVAGEGPVRTVSGYWQSLRPSAFFRLDQDGLASWSLERGSSSDGALQFLARNPNRDGVLLKVAVPFVNTVFDKWVDDASLATVFPRECEIVVGSWPQAPILCNVGDVEAYWKGRIYGYNDRAALRQVL